jgi:molecular chaperone DnaJ
MATDLYTLLGITQAASVADIDRAHRRLSRRYHPGINPGDQVAAAMYRQIQNAYQVLIDADRRRQYDLGVVTVRTPPAESAVAFEGFDFSSAAEGQLAATFSELFADVFEHAAREATTPTRGADIELDLTIPFLDAARGAELPLSVTRQERCPTCGGAGRIARPAGSCPVCRGEGTRRWARGHMVFTKTCEACEGTGRLAAERCRPCAGIGTTPRTEVVTLPIPAGLESGARIAVPGRGHAGARGGPTGDLYVTLVVADHPHFRRAGRDLELRLPIGIHEAALGADVDVPTLDGPARLRIPPGTASGDRLRLKGHGVRVADPSRDRAGDLIVEIAIVLPADLDDEAKALLDAFGRRYPAVTERQRLFEGA